MESAVSEVQGKQVRMYKGAIRSSSHVHSVSDVCSLVRVAICPCLVQARRSPRVLRIPTGLC